MGTLEDLVKGTLLWGKSIFPSADIIPGRDVTQEVSGVPAQQVWHATQPTAVAGTGVPPAVTKPISPLAPEGWKFEGAPTPPPAPPPSGPAGPSGVLGAGTDVWSQIAPYYQGWNQNQATQDFYQVFGGDIGALARSRGFSGGGGYDEEAMLNAIYQPTMDYLGTLEGQYTQEEATKAGEPIETSYQSALVPIEEREATQQALIGGQEEKVTGEKASALAQARQLHQEGLQGIIGRFGAGSSTGPAASELLARESMGMVGGIQKEATSALNALADEGRRLSDFVGRQKEVLVSKKEDALNNLRREFRDKLAQIQAMKGQVESEKAAGRLDQLNRYKEQAFQIEQADRAFQRQLTMFEATKSEQLAQQFSANTGIAPATALTFQRLLATGRGYTPEAAAAALGMPGVGETGASAFMSPWEYIEDQDLWYNKQTGETSTNPPGGGGFGGGNLGVPGLLGGGT